MTDPIDLDDLEGRVNDLYLALPGPQANDLIPRMQAALVELRESRSTDHVEGMPRSEFMEFLREGGKGDCPTCGRYAAIYQRGINVSMARGLVTFAVDKPIDPVTGVGPWVDVPEWKREHKVWGSNDAAQLRHWGLLEPQAEVVRRSNMAEDAPDHGFVGIWRITPDGMRFARGTLSVPRFAVLYNKRLIGLHGEHITIRDVRKFTYEDLPVAPVALAALLDPES